MEQSEPVEQTPFDALQKEVTNLEASRAGTLTARKKLADAEAALEAAEGDINAQQQRVEAAFESLKATAPKGTYWNPVDPQVGI